MHCILALLVPHGSSRFLLIARHTSRPARFMALRSLSAKLTAALHKMQSVTVISEEVLDRMLKDISAALLESDAAGWSPLRNQWVFVAGIRE